MTAAYLTHSGPSLSQSTLTPTGTKPSGLVNGEILIAHIGGRQGGSQNYGPGTSGFVEINLGIKGSSTSRNQLFIKVITNAAGEPASYTFSAATTDICAVTVMRVGGARITKPLAGFSAATSEGGGPAGTVPSFDVTADDSLLIYFGQANTSSTTSWTPPTGFTERYEGAGGSGGTVHNLTGSVRNSAIGVGASGDIAATSASADWAGAVIAIAPATTYVLKSANSDLTGAGDFRKEISEGTEAATGIQVSIAANATEESYGFTPPNVPGSQGGVSGSYVYVAKANISAGGANLRYLNVGVARVDSSGVVQAGPTFGTEVTASTAIHTFNISADLGTFAVGDRLRVTYRFREGNGISWSPTIQAGTLNTSVVVPWALDVDPPAIPTGLIGAGLSHN